MDRDGATGSMPDDARSRSVPTAHGPGRGFAWFAVGPAVLLLALLALSELLTDRFAATQLLWWTPRILLVLAALGWLALGAGLASLLGRPAGDWARLGRASAAALAIGALVVARDWGLPMQRPAGAFRLVHWNGSWVSNERAVETVSALLALEADAIVITDPGSAFVRGGRRRMREAGYAIVEAGRFVLCARVPVVEARPIIASRERYVSRLALATPAGPLSIEAVDLPSSAASPRWLLARSLAADLAAVRGAPPDAYVGDFNITRGSASLSEFAPDHRDAFREAGVGWGGTFSREWPLLAIDLALVAPPWRAVRSEVIDFGFGRHRAQVVDLRRDGASR